MSTEQEHNQETVQESIVFIIDDNEVNVKVLSSLMKKFGFTARSFLQGEEALKSLDWELPDLVLLDIMMPGMDGYAVLSELKSNERTKDIPVIFISALTETAALAKGFSLGGVDYITKPFRPPELLARVTTHIELARTRKRLVESNNSILEANNRLTERTKELAEANLSLELSNIEIEKQHQKYVSLLNSILPTAITERLLQGEQLIADRYSEATIIFIDIVGFTPFASSKQPEEVVGTLNSIFSAFDTIAGMHGVEKVKTIGDAYFGVCGAPIAVENHTDKVAAFALEVMNYSKKLNDKGIKLRIGINTGPVVGGVIGVSKPTFDLWGDTVNVASRMESSSEPGVIQITEAVAQRLSTELFATEFRGEIEIKGKGTMKTWTLLQR